MTPRKITLNIDRITMDRRDFTADDLSAAIRDHVTAGLAQSELNALADVSFKSVRTLKPAPIKGRVTADRAGAVIARAALGAVKR